MIVRTTRIFVEVLAASLLGVMLLAGIAGWRISQGPVPLDFLTPHFVRALNSQGAPFKIKINKTHLAWAGWARTFDIRVVGVRAIAANDRVIAHVPEMSVSISMGGLLKGIVAPTSLDIIGATMRLGRQDSGACTMELGPPVGANNRESGAEVIARLIDAGQLAPDPRRPITYLQRVSLLDAQLIVDDQSTGTIWGAPQADVVLLKESGELRGTFFADLDIGGANTKVNGVATWRPNSEIIQIESEFSGAKISKIAAKLSNLNDFEAFKFDTKGWISMSLFTDGNIKSAQFDITAEKGEVVLDRYWPNGLNLSSGTIQGEFDGDTGTIEIEKFLANFGGPNISAKATILEFGASHTIDARIALDSLQLSELRKFWPLHFGEKSRRWLVKNIPAGELLDTKINLSLLINNAAKNRVFLKSLSGTLKLNDATLNYLDGLPPLKNVAASAVFSRDNFIAKIRSGNASGLSLESAEIRLTQLDGNSELAAIDGIIVGPLDRVLALIDRPRFRYASRLGLRPTYVTGESETHLKFRFPLLTDLSLKKVDFNVTSKLRNLNVPNLVFDKTISAKLLNLKIDKEGMELAGPATIDSVHADVKWNQRFGKNEKFVSSYKATARLNRRQREAIGLPNFSPFVEGPVLIDVAVSTPLIGPKQIALKLSLKEARLRIPGFDWRKPIAQDCIVWLQLLIGSGGKLFIPEFRVGSPDLSMNGSIEFDRHYKFFKMNIGKFSLGRTNISGQLFVRKNGIYDIQVAGASLDANRLLKTLKDPKEPPVKLPPFNLSAKIGRVWFDDKTPINALAGRLVRDSTAWRWADISGQMAPNQNITLSYNSKNKSRKLLIRSNNAGNALRALDILDTVQVQGGMLRLIANSDGFEDTNPWSG